MHTQCVYTTHAQYYVPKYICNWNTSWIISLPYIRVSRPDFLLCSDGLVVTVRFQNAAYRTTVLLLSKRFFLTIIIEYFCNSIFQHFFLLDFLNIIVKQIIDVDISVGFRFKSLFGFNILNKFLILQNHFIFNIISTHIGTILTTIETYFLKNI